MGGGPSRYVPEPSLSAEEKVAQALRERAEWIHHLFPIQSTDDDVDPSLLSSSRNAIISASDGKPTSTPYLVLLPPEIIENILSSLNNRAIKNLRLTCRRFAAIAALRINRVFLSANPLNIQVFRAIADHDVLRHKIVEIIYDDARLWRSAVDAAEAREPTEPGFTWRQFPSDMEWFESERDENIENICGRLGCDDPRRPEHVARARRARAELSLGESWEYYQVLLRQQEEVITSGADADALRYGLQRFSSLRKVTVTPATHGWLFSPLYETPMIRAFPYGFNCPIPRAWPYVIDTTIHAAPWENEKARWRGFNLVTKILAEEQHNVSEYEIDGHYLGTGLNCRLFDRRCEEYDDFVSVLRLPNFKKLKLSLFVDGQDFVDWSAVCNGLLRKALAEATQLEHVSIAMGWDPDGREQLPELRRFLPIECWPKLQHFELWHVAVETAELLSVISQLPDGLLSLQLNMLVISHADGYRDLLNEMRDKLHWGEQRPHTRVIMAASTDDHTRGRAIWVEKEIDDFLKRGGINPFENNGQELFTPCYGMGVVRDVFDPDWTRPWAEYETYRKLGYYETS
ncbi:uncharacterized protein TrAFT101_010085 [Trichoderma asperellum]|uniref:F-box domain-containing protein n=1 Tax=Trichoderma asperellum (strain ATCC 204424 / CBS 433.97 / NBRC 101777) TaxID=1042311 RepID=A0A2T3Z918_TRIA4|nr:hypothetical protein M441DRAFT_57481 [Trichoderma asperellum CBS 433.97]PTB41297.1 hypothetical protein M441DRAFT_57481 [Trichoderma asperellum CBS 433.97]UKZ95236.1 hypothetical protein TrAFT101_010085 [Trichoderma asperellum]